MDEHAILLTLRNQLNISESEHDQIMKDLKEQ